MKNSNNDLTFLAETNYRNNRKLFGIKQKDRLLHTYIIGKTGTGKTNLLQTQILQDICSDKGCSVFDVHGDLIAGIWKRLPNDRIKDVIYLNIPNTSQSYKFNPFLKVPYEKRALVAGGILDTLSKLWSSAWGLKLEHILRYILLTLLDQQEANISDVIKLLDNQEFREECIKNVVSGDIKRFWLTEFKNYTKADLLPIYNKIGAFMVYPAVKRLLIENTTEISFRDILDNRKILLINISKGALGDNVSEILGALLLNSLSFSAFTRIDTLEEKREPFMVYLDEFQEYTSPVLLNMLSELRKFKIGMIVAHQYLDQLSKEIQNAVLGNAGTLITFRLGMNDAKYFATEYEPIFTAQNIANLPNYEIYLKLMIDGTPSKAFSAKTVKWE
ncbi:type IV secretory system conjugative DNA transfer family protein [Niabella aquatica]